MFIDKIGTNPFEDNYSNTGAPQNTEAIAPATIKKRYSFVGSNDTDENIDTKNLKFDEEEINASLQKVGSADNNEYQKKTISGLNDKESSVTTAQIDEDLADIFNQISEAQQNEDFTKANTLMVKYNDLLATRPETAVDTAEISKIDAELASLDTEFAKLAEDKYVAMTNEDEYKQYTIEQKENELWKKAKELKIKKYNLERGGKVSAEELSIYAYNADIEFRSDRISQKRGYLNFKLEQINKAKETAMKNGNEYQQYILEQQENAINALDKIFEMDETDIKSQFECAKSQLDILNTEPIKSTDNNNADKKALLETIKKQVELNFKTVQLASAKSTAMQNEDENQQYVLEQQENQLFETNKELEITKQKLIAKFNGRELSSDEISILSDKLDTDFRKQRLDEKRQYLSYNVIQIASAKSTAMQNEDDYQQYILEQQENAINALDKIFEMDSDAIEIVENYENSALNILNSEKVRNLADNDSNKKEIISVEKELIAAVKEKAELYSQLSTALQDENTAEYNKVLAKIESKNKTITSLKIKEAKTLAKIEGKSFSSDDESKITLQQSAESTKELLMCKRNQVMYKLIQTTTANTTAMKTKDEEQQILLNKYEEELMAFADKLAAKLTTLEKAMESLKSSGSSTSLSTAISDANNAIKTNIPACAAATTTSSTTTSTTSTTGTTTSTTDVGGTITIGQTTTKTIKEETKEAYTKNDGTFAFKGNTLYRKNQKYTGEFEGKLYKRGKLYNGVTNGFRYKKGVKFNGTRFGKLYVNGELAEGEVNGKMFHNGKLLKGLATYTPYKADGKTPDTENAVTTYYKKGVKATGTYKGKLYVNGELFTGTYKKKKYVNGIKQK